MNHSLVLSVDLLFTSRSLSGDRERVLSDRLAQLGVWSLDANLLVDESWGLDDCEWDCSLLCLVSCLQSHSLSSGWRREHRDPSSLPRSVPLAVAGRLPGRRSAAHGRRVFSRKRLLVLRRGHFILQPWTNFILTIEGFHHHEDQWHKWTYHPDGPIVSERTLPLLASLSSSSTARLYGRKGAVLHFLTHGLQKQDNTVCCEFTLHFKM